MTSRRSFQRTAVAALMAQWIKIPELELAEPEVFTAPTTLAQYKQLDLSTGFLITKEMIEDCAYQMLVDLQQQLEAASTRVTVSQLYDMDAYLVTRE